MKFTRYTFLIAGVYGLLVLVPQYFLESQIGADNPPGITHPEFFYGFIGVAAAFQLVFILIGTDPVKYRAMIIPSIVEKFSFVVAILALLLAGRASGPILIGAAIDGLLGVLFAFCWFRLGNKERTLAST
ncbi:MAG: hypothetical protein AB7Q37_03100 [Pyrinomonadaceae bacterium]